MSTQIYVIPYKKNFNWSKSELMNYEDYSIKETDFRVKTAKITSPDIIKVDEGNYAVKIASDKHETFTGIILSKSDKSNKGLYEYQCQDWNRLYMDKLDLDMNGKVYKIVQKIISKSGGSLNGLKKINKYNQGKYGSTFEFNPFKSIQDVSLKHNKTSIEAIKSLVYSQKPFIDIHYDDRGTILFTPYYIDEWLTPKLEIDRVIDFDVKIDTTNILTNVSGFGYKKLFNSKNDYLKSFINIYSGLDDPDDKNNANTSTDKTNNKNAAGKSNNVYKTKNKDVWVVMDRCWGASADSNYYNKLCKELKKLGWNVHKVGIGPGKIIPSSLHAGMSKGVYFIVVNGADCEVFRHVGHDQFFKGMLLKKKCRPVLGLINDAGNIKKGGKYYSHLGMAHDGTGKGSPGLKYPAGYLATCGVPFFYSKGSNPKQCATLFNNGGDSQIALNNNYKKYVKGFYANWKWSSKY